MKLIKAFSMLSISIAMLFVSCAKDGVDGLNGADGATGPAGTANVIYSSWSNFSTWDDTTMANFPTTKRSIRTAPGVTTEILDKGIILTYTKHQSSAGSGPYMLPYTIPSGVDNSVIVAFLPVVGKIIYYNYQTNGAGGVIVSSTYQNRYIIIPGGILGGRGINVEKTAELGDKIYTETELKAMPYNQICSLLKIQP